MSCNKYSGSVDTLKVFLVCHDTLGNFHLIQEFIRFQVVAVAYMLCVSAMPDSVHTCPREVRTPRRALQGLRTSKVPCTCHNQASRNHRSIFVMSLLPYMRYIRKRFTVYISGKRSFGDANPILKVI